LVLGIFVIAEGGLLGIGDDLRLPLGLVVVLCAIGLLIARLRDRPDDDVDDDGAVL
jgi:hypothetical protein